MASGEQGGCQFDWKSRGTGNTTIKRRGARPIESVDNE